MKRFATIALTTVALSAMSATASASVKSDLAGTKWKTKGGKSTVQFNASGSSAKIIKLHTAKGKKNSKKVMGVNVIRDLKNDGTGIAYDPEKKKKYAGTLTRTSKTRLKLEGCVIVFGKKTGLCKTQIWTKVK